MVAPVHTTLSDPIDISPTTAPLPTMPPSPPPLPPTSPLTTSWADTAFTTPIPILPSPAFQTFPLASHNVNSTFNTLLQCAHQLQQEYHQLEERTAALQAESQCLQARVNTLEADYQTLLAEHTTSQQAHTELESKISTVDDKAVKELESVLQAQMISNATLRRNLVLLRKHMAASLEENKRLQQQNQDNFEAAMEGIGGAAISPTKYRAVPSEDIRILLEEHANFLELKS
ncbi:hypothetical protein KP509_19G041000 [Ceratopteris richardii]|uniref:Uncharacterized protein n=1 Tax=Ceratopteris richardii TaxID=49495 RepID=A0A8T2SK17_CERRI|nr:hypothetical protein KP509_19G041000 [Ceratopteris richardii]